MTTYLYELKAPFTDIKVNEGANEAILYINDYKVGTLKFQTKDELMSFLNMLTEDYPTAQRRASGKGRSEIIILREPQLNVFISDYGEIIRLNELKND